MTVEISYFQHVATGGLPVAAEPNSPQSVTISSTATTSSATPDGQTALSICGTEAFRFEYSYKGGTAATAASHYVAAGERLWLTPRSGYMFSLRTA